jgi:SagB-type dehydrogenase family enzyme
MLSSSDIQSPYPEYHSATKHSWRSVQIDPNYVDARTQPATWKIYPHFFRRFPLDPENPVHRMISLTSAITFQKQYREGTHALRVQPSAGALYPTELYVQLRGITGFIDGIYHLEPYNNCLTLLYELIDDGLEGYWDESHLIKGCIFLVSCVYFRSSWKYKNRSLRYCFLDSGHHLGAIEASLYASQAFSGHESHPVLDRLAQLQFDFDHLALNDDFGFETKEFATAMMIVGTAKSKPVRRLRSPLPIVASTDYFEPNRFIEASYKQTLTPSPSSELPHHLKSLHYAPTYAPKFPIEPSQWLQAIQHRRSARRFYPNAIDQTLFWTICEAIQPAIPSEHPEALEIYAVVHRVTGLASGIYRSRFCDRDVTGYDYLQSGAFQEQTGYLCVNQAIARDCAVVFFIVSTVANYRVALQQAGIIGQRIYLAATALDIGCSGIGAFFDDETQAFLGTDRPVLYAVAIGQKH